MGASDIEWTEETWNPVAGCAMVSPGCTNCYAQRMAARLQAMGLEKYHDTTRKSGTKAVWTGRVNVDRRNMEAPLRWHRPRRIFVNSMSDLFQAAVLPTVVEQVWSVMERASWHTFQVLTKRPDLMAATFAAGNLPMLPNVWLGTSVETEEYLPRLDALRSIPASVRFVSFEPLLGPIERPNLSGIHWAIVGGESGPKARPMEPGWVEDIHEACREYHTAFFFKQWGGKRKKRSGRLLDGQTWDEYPTAAV